MFSELSNKWELQISSIFTGYSCVFLNLLLVGNCYIETKEFGWEYIKFISYLKHILSCTEMPHRQLRLLFCGHFILSRIQHTSDFKRIHRWGSGQWYLRAILSLCFILVLFGNTYCLVGKIIFLWKHVEIWGRIPWKYFGICI